VRYSVAVPVLIATASDDLGIVVPLARRLREDGGEVRCYLPQDDGELRHLGCKMAVGHPLDEMNLEASLTNVHTFVPILPDIAGIDDAETLDLVAAYGRVAARAAGDSSIEQTILALPAVPESHPVGRAFAEIAAEFMAASRPVCVIRTGLVWRGDGPLAAGMRAFEDTLPPALEGSVVSVVALDDLVSLLAEVDDREDTHGTWEFGGQIAPLADLRRLDWGTGPPVPLGPWMQDLLASDLVAGASAEKEFGISARPVL
jgi:hypothetical protein